MHIAAASLEATLRCRLNKGYKPHTLICQPYTTLSRSYTELRLEGVGLELDIDLLSFGWDLLPDQTLPPLTDVFTALIVIGQGFIGVRNLEIAMAEFLGLAAAATGVSEL
ncbi:unnamed protein product [Prunus brigantina]